MTINTHTNSPATTLSVRVPPNTRNQLEELASVTGRTKSFLAAEAIEQYLALHAWQIQSIEKSVTHAKNKKAKFVAHKDVAAWLKSWGSKEEQDAPK